MRDGDTMELPSKTTYQLLKNDTIQIETPGGGGYGNSRDRPESLIKKDIREGRIMND
jgi:N-methylhydantoinase B